MCKDIYVQWLLHPHPYWRSLLHCFMGAASETTQLHVVFIRASGLFVIWILYSSLGLIILNMEEFSCNSCKAVFNRKDNLKRHELRHMQSKSFECTECAKWFTLKANLKRHLKMILLIVFRMIVIPPYMSYIYLEPECATL